MKCKFGCAAPWYDLGCEGGDFEGGVDYIIDNGGIDTEEDYPYLAHDDKCMCAPQDWPRRSLYHFLWVSLSME